MAVQEGNCHRSLFPLIRFAVVAPLAILLLVMFHQTGTLQAPRDAEAAAPVVQGDVDCSGVADAVDALQVLLSKAGLSASTQCIDETGDVNCDDAVDQIDSVRILGMVAGNGRALKGCTPGGIAEELYSFVDPANAEALLLAHVYPDTDVGVYAADGTQILDGAETDLEVDFYLYEFEAKFLAAKIVEREGYGLDTLGLFLTEAGFVSTAGADPLTAAQVLSAVSEHVVASRTDETMFAWQLIDELGFAQEQPVDLADPTLDPSATYLDSIQAFLALYELTSSPSASILPQADSPGAAARTRAIHDYAADNARVVIDNVTPTKWKTGSTSTAEDRTVTVAVSYPPLDDELVPLSGPLRGVDPGEFLQNLSGMTVSWRPTAELDPRNGNLSEPSGSNLTDASGKAQVKFKPNVQTRCKKKTTKTEYGVVLATVDVSFVSTAGGRRIGAGSVRATTVIQISHREPEPALQSARAVSSEATDPLEDLTCALEGTVSTTSTVHGEDSIVTSTVTSLDLRFELDDIYPDGSYYRAVGGKLVWSVTSVGGGCHLEQASGDYPANSNNGAADPQQRDAYIRVWDDGGPSLRYEALAGPTSPPTMVAVCDDASFEIPATGVDVWWSAQLEEFRLEADGSLHGAASVTGPGFEVTWIWDLHPAECQPSPVPVCSGTPAIPEAIR